VTRQRRWLLISGVVAPVLVISGCGTRVDTAAPAAAPSAPVPTVAVTQPADAVAPEGQPDPAAGQAVANVPSPAGAVTMPSSSGKATGAAAARTSEPTGATQSSATSVKSTATTAPVTAPSPVPTPGAPPAAPGGSADPIRIGAVGTLSGPAGALLKDAVLAVQVWAKWRNAQGGINGHPVEYSVADDGADPARHRAQVQDFVERRKVIAFVQNQEGLVGPSAADYPTEHRIPVINTEGGGNYPYASPMYFPTTSSGDELAFVMIASLAKVAIPAGKTKLGMITCAEASQCRNFDKTWTSERAKKLGFQVVYNAQASLVAPDFTSECLAAQRAGAQAMIIGMDSNSIGRIATSCQRQGYRPMYGISGNTAQPNIVADPSLDGTVVGHHTWPWPLGATPAQQEFHDVFARYAPNLTPNGAHAVGWSAAKAFELAAAKVAAQPTSEQILQGLWTFRNNDLGGVTYPLTFTQGKPATPRACWSLVIVKNKQWTAPYGGGMECDK
jgi:branched-chain amino acid transport system substrate-binding protein